MLLGVFLCHTPREKKSVLSEPILFIKCFCEILRERERKWGREGGRKCCILLFVVLWHWNIQFVNVKKIQADKLDFVD